MKTTLRLPTADMYAYIEVEIDADSIEGAVTEYNRAMGLVRGGEGIPEADFRTFLDNQAMGNNKNHMETYQAMSPKQQEHVQVNKRMFARLKAKTTKEVDIDYGGGPGKGENGDWSGQD